MRDHIENVLDMAQRRPEAIAFEDRQEPALRIAAEAIRLARLAASAHMILSARLYPDETETGWPGRPAESGELLGRSAMNWGSPP